MVRDTATDRSQIHNTVGEVAQAEAVRAGSGLALMPSSRHRRAEAEAALDRARERLEAARAGRQQAEWALARLEAGEAERLGFVAREGWRSERLAAIGAELDRHWATATLAAVRQDDPLAFGVDRLRAARAIAAGDLAAYRAGLPPDRSDAVRQAERCLADAGHALRQARVGVAGRRRALEAASARHWGRRDKDALAGATGALERAEDAAAQATLAEHDARERLDAEVSTMAERFRALAATEDCRIELTDALAELDAALDHTRAGRVAELADLDLTPTHLAGVLGQAPTDPRGRQAWCGLAERIESYRDRHPDALGHEEAGGVVGAVGPRPAKRWMPAPDWDDLAGRLRHGREVVAVAAQVAALAPSSAAGPEEGSWAEVFDQAAVLLKARSRQADRGLYRDDGLGLGL